MQLSATEPSSTDVLSVEDLVVEFPAGRGEVVHAVSGVTFSIAAGETLGLVGESGCGKSTLGKAITGLIPATSGRVVFDGIDLSAVGPGRFRELRPRLQMIFQDPISSLNPRRKVRDVVREPLRIWKRGTAAEQYAVADEVLEAVGLDPATARHRRRGQYSGGQCQRISVARSLVLDPDVLVCDEPVSALDVSVQAQILNLLEDMKERFGLTMFFISHDLAVVKNIADRVVVMYLGKLCEIADSSEIYREPAHPYTRALMAAIPIPDPGHQAGALPLEGELPSPISPPSGCRFRTRCAFADEQCATEEPELLEIQPGHYVACHHPLDSQPVSVGGEMVGGEA